MYFNDIRINYVTLFNVEDGICVNIVSYMPQRYFLISRYLALFLFDQLFE